MAKRKARSFRGELEELIALLRAYVLQETVGPLRTLGRFLAFGLAGTFFVSISVLLAALGLLRLLQAEVSLFDDGWSFAPYLITAAAVLLVLAAAIGAITQRSTGSKSDDASNSATPAPDESRSQS